MSGNIHDTDIHLIKKQVNELLTDIKNIKDKGESLDDWESHLENKYKKLYTTSKTLFTYIIKNYTNNDFNSEFFNKTLNLMLSKIASIQKNNMSQNDASIHVGTHLAETFIPQLKK